ncbi:YxeA family protein [Furfurilactobacillus entadae]|uniref:YxeA family protein n=1 Tax=Furfurilactobacillus entadae TaxID=2922307 RepID=UPI0035E4ACC4
MTRNESYKGENYAQTLACFRTYRRYNLRNFFGLNEWDRYNKSGDIYYVHIIKDGKEEVRKDDNDRKFIDYHYEMTAYNDKGDAKAVDFKGTPGTPLTLNSYLKLTVNPQKV